MTKRLLHLIYRLEKSKAFWFILFIIPFFFLLRFPSIVEPVWYGDEGIYQVLGKAINHGEVLYRDVWDNKPPLLYVTYALFNSDQFSVRLASLVVGLLAAIALFFLSQKLFNKNLLASVITTVLFSILFATPFIEGNIANAENFMLLPVILAGLFINQLSNLKQHKLKPELFAGLLLGIAFLFKIVALFDFAAFFIFLVISTLPKKLSVSSLKQINFRTFGMILLGFFLPLVVTTLYFVSQNALADFIRATFFGNIGYVGWGNKLIIPQGLLILKLVLLAIVVLILFVKRQTISKATIFIVLWVAFSLFSTFFSGRPYTHYVLVSLPSICLLVGLLFTMRTPQQRTMLGGIILLVFMLINTTFHFYPLRKTVSYYQNVLLFLTAKKDVTSYQSFFDRKTPRDYELASFIRKHTTPSDQIFIWGDSAQIYALADKLPPSKYTVAYHITQNKNGIEEMQQKLDEVKPKYIIILEEAPKMPFHLAWYHNPFTFQQAIIYERYH